MNPEEITTDTLQEEAFAALLAKTLPAPSLQPLPRGLSERIAAATDARPTFWERLTVSLRPAPVRFALGGTVTAVALCAVFLPRLSLSPQTPQKAESPTQVAKATNPTPSPVRVLVPTPAPPRVPEVKPDPSPSPATPAPVLVFKATPTPEPTPTPGVIVVTPAPHKKNKARLAPSMEKIRVASEPSTSANPTLSAPESTTGSVAQTINTTNTTVAAGRSATLEPEAVPTPSPTLTPSVSVVTRSPRTEVASVLASDEEKPFNPLFSLTKEEKEQMKKEPKIASLSGVNSGIGSGRRPGANVDLLSAPVR
ncbi:MAG: hypothetical protein NTX57_01415 [Armatimonadetes bacterium]|nr:hypothetical protein [Armatimonadota bacterium]